MTKDVTAIDIYDRMKTQVIIERRLGGKLPLFTWRGSAMS